jgi:hypothetical protein
MEKVSVFLLRHCDALQYQDNGTARGANIDGLIGRVQHQHWGVQGMGIAFLMDANTKDSGSHSIPASFKVGEM